MSKWFNNNSNDQVDNADNRKVIEKSYQEYGNECSFIAQGEISTYRLHLSTIYSGHIIAQDDIKSDNSEQIKPLQNQIDLITQDIEEQKRIKCEDIPQKMEHKDLRYVYY